MGGPHEKIRKRSRIDTELPVEVRQETDRLLIEGATYEEISAYLKANGHDISKSSVGRYGKDFLNLYRRIRVMEDKSRALSSEPGEMALEEAASKLFTGEILELLMAHTLDIGEKSRIIGDFAKLQSSSVARERLKSDTRKKIDAKLSDLESKARKGTGLDPETLRRVREEIYGIV
jgi:hypothetical protein